MEVKFVYRIWDKISSAWVPGQRDVPIGEIDMFESDTYEEAENYIKNCIKVSVPGSGEMVTPFLREYSIERFLNVIVSEEDGKFNNVNGACIKMPYGKTIEMIELEKVKGAIYCLYPSIFEGYE